MSAWFLCCGSWSGNVCFPSSAHAVTLFSSRWVSDASLGEAWPCSKVSVSSAALAEVCGLSASVAWVINLNSSLIYFFISEFFFRYNFHGMQRAYIKLSKWFSNYVYLFICVCVYRCMCAKACMQRSEDNLCESTLCESWGLNVGCRSWQHAVYPLSHLTYFFSLKKKKRAVWS